MWPFTLFKKHAQKPSSPDEDTVQVPIGEFMKSREGHFTGADHPLRPCPSSISIPVGYPTPNGYTIIPDGMYPVIRVDGHCFHTFTRKFEKPFDDRMERAMQHATKELIKFFTACYGYTQSDEITVVLPKASQDFGRKTHKLASIAASIATGAFIESMKAEGVPMPKLPVFDGRAFAIPEATEIGYYQVWRQRDSARNAISAVARSKFSHKALDGKNSDDKVEMLKGKGVDFWKDYSTAEIFGHYFKRKLSTRTFSPEEIAKLPEKHEARVGYETGHPVFFTRSDIVEIECKVTMDTIPNDVAMLLKKETPPEPQTELLASPEEPGTYVSGN